MREIIADGLHVPEGPYAHEDGSLTFTEQLAGRVSRYDDGEVSVVAVTGGAPNSAIGGSDGALYVCQNGGVVGAWRSPAPVTPQVQRILPGGAVETVAVRVAGRDLRAPNDLAFGPDGRLHLTDPAQPFDPASSSPAGRILALGPGGGELVAEVGGVYCNGIAFLPDGRLVWVESYTRAVCTLDGDGRPQMLCRLPDGHTPDGLAVAGDGRMFIASCGSHGISVVGPAGEYLGLIELDAAANPTNCCFAGSALYVTDFGMDWDRRDGAGRLWRIDTDARGLAPHAGSLP
jgi:gluconolactonase